MREPLAVLGLALTNVGAAVAAEATKAVHWLESLEPYMHFLTGAVQIAVGAVTVLYIWRKIKNLPNKKG